MSGIFFVRHTKLVGTGGLCYGRLDPPLAESFPQEAEAVLDRLRAALAASKSAGKNLRLFSSPAERCRVLAHFLQSGLGLNGAPVFCPELRELDFGAWEGRPWKEIPREETEPWMEDFVNRAPPGGESFRQMADRVLSWTERHSLGFEAGGEPVLREASASREQSCLLAVTHAGVMRILRALRDNRGLDRAFAVGGPDYGEIDEY